MNQEATGRQKLQQDLYTLRVGEMLVYGHVNRLGTASVDMSVSSLVRTLESEDKIMRFQRKISTNHDFELVAVGTTRALNESIAESVKRYEVRMGLT